MTIIDASCGEQRPHEPHQHGFMFQLINCPGQPIEEFAVTLTRVMNPAYRRVRDEVAPALRRDLKGIIVTVDECIVYSQYEDHPDYQWHGGSMTILGLEYGTARNMVQILSRELGLWDDRDYPQLRTCTPKEIEALKEHRA